MLKTKTIAIIVDPRAQIKGAFPNIPKILKSLGFKCIILTNPKNALVVDLPDNVELHEPFLFDIMNNIISKVPRLIGNIIGQTWVALNIMNIINKVDIFLFSHVLMPIPTIELKILKKKAFVLVGGVSHLVVPPNEQFIKKLTYLLEDIQYKLSDTILVVSKVFINFQPLAKYKEKVFETPMILFDAEFLRSFNFYHLSDKGNVAGFVGRFSWEKGIAEFIEAIPLVLSKTSNVTFMIIGDGPLRDTMVKKLNSFELHQHINLLPWVKNVEKYLKDIKLLVISSWTEGLPSIMLEAMACGTPVLATPVGAIPDVIEDGETGFLLKSNDPEHIADRIVELLGKPELLEKVSVNAYNYVRENFSYEKTLEAWRKILKQLEITK